MCCVFCKFVSYKSVFCKGQKQHKGTKHPSSPPIPFAGKEGPRDTPKFPHLRKRRVQGTHPSFPPPHLRKRRVQGTHSSSPICGKGGSKGTLVGFPYLSRKSIQLGSKQCCCWSLLQKSLICCACMCVFFSVQANRD